MSHFFFVLHLDCKFKTKKQKYPLTTEKNRAMMHPTSYQTVEEEEYLPWKLSQGAAGSGTAAQGVGANGLPRALPKS